MSFYEQISNHYDEIFPLSPNTVDFLSKLYNQHSAHSVLDVACGSGTYVQALSGNGFEAYGMDLDSVMVTRARDKVPYHRVMVGNMLQASAAFSMSFDAMYCIGNSLVHLIDEASILTALHEFYKLLAPKGILCIQIINYDRILDLGLTGLPTIENKQASLTFERQYVYNAQEGLIYFQTRLAVPEGTFENSIPLFPLRMETLSRLLAEAGFVQEIFHGDFKEAPWQANSYTTIVTATKK